MTLRFETERLVLRIPNESDIPHIFSAAKVPGFTDGMLWNPPKSSDELLETLEQNLKSWRAGTAYNFTIEDKSSGEFLGRISIRENKNLHSIGFWTHPKHQRKGIMKEALAEILRFGFEDLGLERIEACHALWNIASKKVLQACGMKFVKYLQHSYKKNGKWVEENLMAITLKDWTEL